MEISLAARDVLARAAVNNTTIMLPEQLDRDLYQEVNEVLVRLGGKWQRKAQGHVFPVDPRDDLHVVIATGLMPPKNVKNPLAFFPTPRKVVDRMLHDAAFGLCQIDLASIPRPRLLEPSAGRGAIAFPLREYAPNPQAVVHCCELDQTWAAFLRSEGLPVVAEDFLTYQPAEGYHAILMNPPFSVAGGDKLAYLAHIEHAWEMLLPGGLLTAIAPPGFTFRTDRRARRFLALVEEHGLWEPLPDETFAESGTRVQTVLLSLHKPYEGKQEGETPPLLLVEAANLDVSPAPHEDEDESTRIPQPVQDRTGEPVQTGERLAQEKLLPLPQDDKDTTAQAVLLHRLGLDALPAHKSRVISLDRLIVPGAESLRRSVQQLAKSIAAVGILQPPLVICQHDSADPDATFEVVAGRRRVLAAGLVGLTAIKCEVYETGTLQLSSLLTLIENEQRSSAWIKEVEALRQLMDEKVGLTMDDLASFGFARQSLAERLKIAQLPTALVEQILAGNVSRDTARRLTRLTRLQQERLAALAQAGELLTPEMVRESLRGQIDAGFIPVQASLSQGETQPGEVSTVPATSATDPTSATQALTALVEALHCFAQSEGYRDVPQIVRSLATALMQQAEMALKQSQQSKEQ